MGYTTYTCPIARRCGGCEWLAVPYPIQLGRKREAVEATFEGLLDDLEEPVGIRGMEGDAFPDGPRFYRCKCATPFAPGRKGSIRSGFYERGTHRIVACERCLVEDPRGRVALHALARSAEEAGLRAYDENRGRGLLRHGVVRLGWKSDDALLTVVTNGEGIPRERRLVEGILARAPFITSIAQNVNQRPGNAILGRENRTLHGPGTMVDELLGVRFRLGPTSFYQTNPSQTEVLYSIALEFAGLEDGERLLDAYCGIGAIGLVAAKATPGLSVAGVERVAAAIENAKANARENGLSERARFIADDATAYMVRAARDGERFDAVVLDPPRSGATPAFLKAAAALAPRRIVYVSCNPATQRRDAEALVASGYRLVRLCVVDLFPHTAHAETVALFER